MNKWIGIGRLVADAELRFTPGKGTANLQFRLAIDDGYGEHKKTYFIPIVVWGKSAESLSSYLLKGTQIAVSGKISTRSYEAQDGTKRYVTEVIADMYGGIKLLGSKNNFNQDNNGTNNFGNQNQDVWSQGNFEEDIMPVDDGDMPF